MLARSRGLKGCPFKLLVTWCFRSFAGFYCRSVNVKSVGLCVAKHAGGVCALVNASSLPLFLPGHEPGGGCTAVRPPAWASQAPGFRGGPGRAARRPWGTSKGVAAGDGRLPAIALRMLVFDRRSLLKKPCIHRFRSGVKLLRAKS